MKINRLTQIILAASIVLSIIGVRLFMMAESDMTKASKLAFEVGTLKKQKELAGEITKSLADTDTPYQELERLYVHNSKEFVALLNEIEFEANKAGVSVEFLLEQNNDIKGPTKNLFSRQFPIRATGNISSLNRFFVGLEGMNRLLGVRTFSVRGSDLSKDGQALVKVEVGWSVQ